MLSREELFFLTLTLDEEADLSELSTELLQPAKVKADQSTKAVILIPLFIIKLLLISSF